MAVTGIDQFMSKIGKQRGMSLTTGFDVFYDLPSGLAAEIPYYTGDNKDLVHMLCDEAQLPNVQTATGQLSGRFLGESAVQYPHSRMFTDVGLGFLCDAELIPLKFFNMWYNYIFEETEKEYFQILDKSREVKSNNDFRENRLRYQDEYAATIRIVKTEPDDAAPNNRAPITYLLENAYPYAIDAVPLSYGSSQLTRVNVNFHYSRHTVAYGTWNIKSDETPSVPLALNFVDDKNNLTFTTDGTT